MGLPPVLRLDDQMSDRTGGGIDVMRLIPPQHTIGQLPWPRSRTPSLVPWLPPHFRTPSGAGLLVSLRHLRT